MSDILGCRLRDARPGTDDEAVASLMVEYLTWAHTRLREDYCVDEPPTDPAMARASLGNYRRPAAALIIAERRGAPVGVGAIRGLGSAFAEIKRMYVTPEGRGLHIGSAILDRLMDEARSAGSDIVRLDTARFMTEAHNLYRSRGFLERSPYDETEIPPRLQHLWLYFERDVHD